MTVPRPVKLEHPIVAALYDAYMWPQELLGFRRQRKRMASEATGRVLELAAGTGLTFPFYVHAQEVVAIDPDPFMLTRARRRAANAPCPVRLLQADAESLPFDDGEFDTLLIAFGLCKIPRAEIALREAHRVLKPDGRLLFLEHVRSRGPRVARLQTLPHPPGAACLAAVSRTVRRLRRSSVTSTLTGSGERTSSRRAAPARCLAKTTRLTNRACTP